MTAHQATAVTPIADSVAAMDELERQHRLTNVATYQSLGARARQVRADLLDFLAEARREGKTVVAYGAPAKGNTLLNFAGVDTASVAYTVDRSPHKQGLFLPGSRLPIFSPDRIFEDQPDYVLLLPWNLREEIASQMAAVRQWGGSFVTPIPRLEVF